MQTKICIEMETGDIDDVLTLILLLQNTNILVKAISVTPGSLEQIGLVEYIVKTFGTYIVPIGGFNSSSNAKLSHFYPKTFPYVPAKEFRDGIELFKNNSGDDVILFTIGPPKTSGNLLVMYPQTKFKEIVAQGGFAGVGVVPEELILEKFSGMSMCSTCNFNGGKEYTHALLNSQIPKKYCVGKNICHGFIYDEEMDKVINKNIKGIMHKVYGDGIFEKRKAMHDLLASVCILDKTCFNFAEVEILYEKGKFGSKLKSETGIYAGINYDREKVLDFLK